MGTIFGDTLLAPLFFAAILLGLHSLDVMPSDTGNRVTPAWKIVAAGGLAGLAAGLSSPSCPLPWG